MLLKFALILIYCLVMDVWKETHSIDPKIAGKLENILTEAGLERVTTRFVSVPIGDWGLDIGVLWEQNFFTFLESAMPFLLNITNYSEAEYRAKKNLMKEEFKHYKSFMNIYVIWGYVPN
jgi:hypothetical protein